MMPHVIPTYLRIQLWWIDNEVPKGKAKSILPTGNSDTS